MLADGVGQANKGIATGQKVGAMGDKLGKMF